MKAIILASGVGKRLLPLTKDIPKSMIKINDKTLIERQIDSFSNQKIKDIIITTGIFEDKLKYFLEEKYQDLNIIYVNNPQYDSTNYIYSLWLTKDLIDDDIILIHGDLVFDEKLLKKLIEGDDNLVLIKKDGEIPAKDFKAIIEKGKIEKIGVDFFSKNACSSMPMYRFIKKDFQRWMEEIEEEIKNGNLNIYAEDAFNKISDEIILKPFYFNKEVCMEIDNKEDLMKAINLLK